VVNPWKAEAQRSRAVSFRLAPEASIPLNTASELERQLRRRLRRLSMIAGGAMGSLGVFAAIMRRTHIAADAMSFFTEPPLPGVLILVSLGFFACLALVAPRRPVSIRRLRAIESAGVGLLSIFMILNQTLGLATFGAMIADKPMEVGMAQGAPWAMLIVGYAVLIPGSIRRAFTRTGIVTALAFVPDLLTRPASGFDTTHLLSYLVLKLFIISVMSALAIYGSYRIEELGQQVEVARELGQYLLRRSLGEGGMGQVFLAEHKFLRRPCAVKLIRADQADSELALARFEREVQSAAALTHPNTVHIYDYGRSDDGTFYFAMEFLPGISLDEFVTQYGPLAPERAVHVLVQLCGALQEAHDHGLVHRDLKPGNVMLCERGGMHDVAKLLDFGLVAAIAPEEPNEKITQAGMMMGTPAYMSPEQCAGDETITASSDIYALGALGYFLVTGSPPFAGRSATKTLIAHMSEPAPRLTTVSPGLAEVLRKCLEKSSENRYPSVANLAEALVHSVGAAEWTPLKARDWWRDRQPEGREGRREQALAPSS
jgi:tRNA A-37 threonylcarbamoyl transferase component Bud32